MFFCLPPGYIRCWGRFSERDYRAISHSSLTECNEAIGQCGPEMSRGKERITVKLRKGQQTAVDNKNISVASFSGNIIIFE